MASVKHGHVVIKGERKFRQDCATADAMSIIFIDERVERPGITKRHLVCPCFCEFLSNEPTHVSLRRGRYEVYTGVNLTWSTSARKSAERVAQIQRVAVSRGVHQK